MAVSGYAYCSQPHPAGDDEARDHCARYHRPMLPRTPAQIAAELGAVLVRRSRQTGRLIGLYQDFDGAPWAIICEDHSQVSNFEHRYGPAGAQALMADPMTWCEVCNGNDTEGIPT